MKSKKRPTRDDLAAAFRTIRDQYQIIKLLTEKDCAAKIRCWELY
jgi:hypothetical protein